jgi:ectoine hydroxylase-related dioxygenase (phytanoyl-CoA dioxygenase family)
MIRDRIEKDGFTVVPRVIADSDIEAVLIATERMPTEEPGRGGMRNLLDQVPAARVMATNPNVRALAEDVLGPGCFIVRSILFDKTPSTNWKVSWHQDLAIAVRERLEVPAFMAWSEKAGVPHVQPPSAVLEAMVTVRLHLDDCGEDNGPLRVIAGSHRYGRLSDDEIAEWRTTRAATTITAAKGDALIMRPLLLHASSAAVTPGHRRVVHFEFAATELPDDLDWQWRW